MRNTFNLVWRLLLICLIAGLVLGLVNDITKGPIAAQNKLAADEAHKKAFPEAAEFKAVYEGERDDNPVEYYEVYNEAGELIGYLTSKRAHGYGGDIEVMVGMDLEGKFTGVVIGANGDFSETAGLGAKVKDNPEFEAKFAAIEYKGEEIEYKEGGGGYTIPAGSLSVEKYECESDSGEGVDAISGATRSSNAVMKAFNEAAAQLYALVHPNEGGAN